MRRYVVLAAICLLAGCAPGGEGTQPTTGARSEARRDMGPHDPGGPPPPVAPEPSGGTSRSDPGSAHVVPAARLDGYAGLRFGMDPSQAERAWGSALEGASPGAHACVYLMPARAVGAGSPAFMFERARFVRYDVDMPREVAPGGGRAGMSRARIEALYRGRVRAAPHDYVPGGHTLRIADDAVPGRAMLFETDAQGQVTRWRVGLEPQVDYTEGCS